MIRGSPIKPHYPVAIQVRKRPKLTKVLELIKAKKWLEAEPAFPSPKAQTKLQDLGWRNSRFSTMNPMQDRYSNHLNYLGIREASVELRDVYCQWSAI